ncbi:hypothetical protein ERO13_A08G193500v2 [Gossypium hirsutum]|uniref:Uncharacterized protein isoform X5 n=1 Tax=Gossypium hirsutum TaxID=3635 RepID=A0ABM2YK76_GOSHI|nr:uncharacterized protein LOC107953250 isoform X5 [Gossypium hirsutum]KAG4188889.1 hypothetical protein ERO13_A08G193500v2 [Gossypium hirsutum]
MVEGSQVTPKKSSLDDPRSEFPADTICQDKVCIAKNNGNFVPRKKKKKQEEKVILWYLRFSAKRDFAVFTTVREAEIINDNSTKQIPFTGLILAGGLLTMLILWLRYRQTNQLKLTMLDAIMKSIQSAQFRLPIVRKQKVAVTILSSVATTSAGGYL